MPLRSAPSMLGTYFPSARRSPSAVNTATRNGLRTSFTMSRNRCTFSDMRVKSWPQSEYCWLPDWKPGSASLHRFWSCVTESTTIDWNGWSGWIVQPITCSTVSHRSTSTTQISQVPSAFGGASFGSHHPTRSGWSGLFGFLRPSNAFQLPSASSASTGPGQLAPSVDFPRLVSAYTKNVALWRGFRSCVIASFPFVLGLNYITPHLCPLGTARSCPELPIL